MKLKINSLLLVLFFFIIFILFYKSLKNTNVYTPEVNVEKNIPFFNSIIFNSEDKINSNEIFESNQFYIFNIWASWCVPCRKEHSYLMQLSKKKNLKIIGLNYKDDTRKAKKFLNELKNPFDMILLDKDGTIAIEWGAYGVPETFIVFNKKIIKKIIGPITDQTLIEIENLTK